MFLVPLNQIESVELVVHALRVAGGEADCSTCPARKVCMKQCLTIAGAIETMLSDGTLPSFEPEEMDSDVVESDETKGSSDQDTSEKDSTGAKAPVSHLKIIK